MAEKWETDLDEHLSEKVEGHDVVINGVAADTVTSQIVSALLTEKGRVNRLEKEVKVLREEMDGLYDIINTQQATGGEPEPKSVEEYSQRAGLTWTEH